MKSLKFVFIEPDQLVRSAVALVLKEAGHHVAADFALPRQALPYLETNRDIDMIIGEMSMRDDRDTVQTALARNPDLKLLILTGDSSLQHVRIAMTSGASAYVLKECYHEELELAIRCVVNKKRYIHSSIAQSIFEMENFWNLNYPMSIDLSIFNDRELEVLELIGQGMTNEQMAERLYLSRRTVEGYRQSLLNKGQCKNSAELIRFAMRNGLLQ